MHWPLISNDFPRTDPGWWRPRCGVWRARVDDPRPAERLDSPVCKVYVLCMFSEVALTDARTSLGELAARAEYGGETVYLTRHGRRTAAVVSAAAAELLEQLEDLLDVEAITQVQERLAAGTEGRRRLVNAEPGLNSDNLS